MVQEITNMKKIGEAVRAVPGSVRAAFAYHVWLDPGIEPGRGVERAL